MNRLLGFGLALASVTLADKPLGQYSSGGGFGGFGGGSSGGFGGAGDFGSDAQYAGGAGGGDNLEEVIPGLPGEDYPIYSEVPDTSFLCDGQTDGGYYSDPEAECQVFHICAGDGTGGLTKYSFLCPNGTLFNQQYFVCDWWFNVDCSLAESLYSLNDEIAAERDANSPDGGQGQYGSAGGQGQYGGGQGGQGGAGGRSGGRGGQSQYGSAGGRSGSGGRRGGSSAGSRASASSARGSYSAPSDSYSSSGSNAAPTYTFPDEVGFGPADSGYGAPGGSGSSPLDTGYGAPASGGYGAPSYSGRRRNARQLAPADTELETAY